MRLITSPSAIHVAVWQELYFRWCALTEMTVRGTSEQTNDSLENGVAPVGDKTLPMEVCAHGAGFDVSLLKSGVRVLGAASAMAEPHPPLGVVRCGLYAGLSRSVCSCEVYPREHHSGQLPRAS